MSSADAPSKVPAAGMLLLGKYRVERTIDSGGMGVVLAARHVQLNEPVAIKLLHAEVAGDPMRYARFVREARAASRIKSEHVVRVFDLGTLDDGSPYIAMEHLEGSDLASVVSSRGPLPIAEAVDYVLQACEGVAEAHLRGIVHRDLKPANLFLTRRSDGSPCVKVLDFGISKVASAEAAIADADSQLRPPPPAFSGEARVGAATAASSEDPNSTVPASFSLTRTRGRLGSPLYMSPEQVRSAKHVDARSDIWALGTILHELLTGRPPFDAPNAEALRDIILHDAPADLRLQRSDAPPALADVVARCLRKEPNGRFADVGELAVALSPFASSEGRASAERAPRILRPGEERRASSLPPVDSLAKTEPDPSASGGAGASALRAKRPFRWGLIAFALVVCTMIGTFVLSFSSRILQKRQERASAARASASAAVSPLAAPTSRLACVVFEARGMAPPLAWLGAAASQTACQRARWTLGGLPHRVLLPADLLDAPHVPPEGASDIYADDAVRARTIDAARKRAAAYLDGTVALRGNDIDVTLSLHASDGRPLAFATGTSVMLWEAVRDAYDKLAQTGHWLDMAPLDPTVGQYEGVEDGATGQLMDDADESTLHGNEYCERLYAARGRLLFPEAALHICSSARGLSFKVPTTKVDVSSGPSLFNTAYAALIYHDVELDAPSVAAAAHQYAEQARTPNARSRLYTIEAVTRERMHDHETATTLALQAIEQEPSNGMAWWILSETTPKLAGPGGATWLPSKASAWWWSANTSTRPETKAEYLRRAAFLDPHSDAIDYALEEIASGHSEEARMTARRCEAVDTDGSLAIVRDVIYAYVHSYEGRIQDALADISRAVRRPETDNLMARERAGHALIALDDVTTAARPVIEDFARDAAREASEPGAIPFLFGDFTELALCARARPSLARPCGDRVIALIAARTDPTSAANSRATFEAVLRKDLPALLRELKRGGSDDVVSLFAPRSLRYAAGLTGAYEAMLATLDERKTIGGINPWTPWVAKAALQRHDYAKARELAELVIDHWSRLDVDAPAVDEMKALLKRLP